MFYKDSKEQSLEDNLLVNLVALSMSLTVDEFALLEQKLCDAVLGDNCSRAVFVTRYWVLLAKLTDSKYTVPTVMSLCNIYENLELNNSFKNSPQEIQLGQIIRRLFEVLPNHYKVLVKKQYEIQEKYYSLWSFIKIKNLPENIRVTTEENLLEKLSLELNKLRNSEHYMENDMRQLISILHGLDTGEGEFVTLIYEAPQNPYKNVFCANWYNIKIYKFPSHLYYPILNY
ncbi:hypothetical protein RR48_13261 [Papilio machaon]|uniref:Uncharacterized protein n=1 Tax=Papilio machaon TaxID=76193 RepID=A0A194QVX6_PAPMA|nr:hypothetical protein RR48_13261 [Papilio machaon]